MLDKRLNDKGKNWRHVLKSLKVLDYCLHEGSELVVTWARKNIYIIKTLREFQYIDEDGRDVGQNGRLRSPLTRPFRLIVSSSDLCKRAHFTRSGRRTSEERTIGPKIVEDPRYWNRRVRTPGHCGSIPFACASKGHTEGSGG